MMGGSSVVAVNATFMLSGMLGIQLQLSDGSTSNMTAVMKDVPFSLGNSSSLSQPAPSCGTKVCDPFKEMCISWERHLGHHFVKECIPTTANELLFSSRSDERESLCGPKEAYSLMTFDPTPCPERASCDVVWKYKCVKEGDAPHSCKTRKCPPRNVCVEQVHCEPRRPCITISECGHVSLLDHYHG